MASNVSPAAEFNQYWLKTIQTSADDNSEGASRRSFLYCYLARHEPRPLIDETCH